MTTPAPPSPPAPPVTAPGTTTGGVPALTAEQIQRVLVQPLEDSSIFLNSGVTIYNTNGSPVKIPMLVGLTEDPTWVGESERIPDETALETTELRLLPEHMRSVKVISRFSNELLRQSIVDFATAVKDRLVHDVVDKLDNALISSTVIDGSMPLGMLNYPGTQKMTGVGTLTLDHCHDALGAMLDQNVDPSKLKWFMRSSIFTHLRKLKDGNERFQLQPDPAQVGGYQLFGIPIIVTNRIPGGSSTTVTLADMSKIAVARDLAPSVTPLPELYANYDQFGLRVITRYDALPTHPQAILHMQGVTA